MVHGICDNLVIATYMSAKCPVFIAPAMDLDMYAHPSTKENLEKSRKIWSSYYSSRIWELASGLEGQGRLAEPETILQKIEDFLLKINLKL